MKRIIWAAGLAGCLLVILFFAPFARAQIVPCRLFQRSVATELAASGDVTAVIMAPPAPLDINYVSVFLVSGNGNIVFFGTSVSTQVRGVRARHSVTPFPAPGSFLAHATVGQTLTHGQEVDLHADPGSEILLTATNVEVSPGAVGARIEWTIAGELGTCGD
jgi:hypothetical protein